MSLYAGGGASSMFLLRSGDCFGILMLVVLPVMVAVLVAGVAKSVGLLGQGGGTT